MAQRSIISSVTFDASEHTTTSSTIDLPEVTISSTSRNTPTDEGQRSSIRRPNTPFGSLHLIELNNGTMEDYVTYGRPRYFTDKTDDLEADDLSKICSVTVPDAELSMENRTLLEGVSTTGGSLIYFRCNVREYCCQRYCCHTKTSTRFARFGIGIRALVLIVSVPFAVVIACSFLVVFLIIRSRRRRLRCVRPHLFQQNSYSSAADVSSIKTSTKPSMLDPVKLSLIKGRKEKGSTKSTSTLVTTEDRRGSDGSGCSWNSAQFSVDLTPNPSYASSGDRQGTHGPKSYGNLENDQQFGLGTKPQ